MRRYVPFLLAALVVNTAWSQNDQKTALKADAVDKNIVGHSLIRPLPTQAICQALLPHGLSIAVAQASDFCTRWYTCPTDAPLYYAPAKGLDACKCEQIGAGQPNAGSWSAICDLAWNGVCGCQSPSPNPDVNTLETELTPLEADELAVFYPVLARRLSATLKAMSRGGREQLLNAVVESLRNFRDGRAFRATLRSRDDKLSVDVALAQPLDAKVPGTVATLQVGKDGTALVSVRRDVPGGVARGLATALMESAGAMVSTAN